MTPLYDRIAITNAHMARRLELEKLERMLAEYAADGRRSYEQILKDPHHEPLPGPLADKSS